MNVDMPDETEETDLVDVGELQLETAFLHNGYDTGMASNIGQLMLRYGIAQRIELRLLIEDGRQRDRYVEETVQSTSPLAIGTKVSILKDHSWLPDMTFVGYLKLPITSRTNQQKPYWSPILLMAFQHKFGEKWKFEYNLGVQQEAFSTKWNYIGNGSLHYKIADPLEVFIEYYAQFKNGEEPDHNLGGGLAYQIGQSVELYLSSGTRIISSERNHFYAGGVAFRLP